MGLGGVLLVWTLLAAIASMLAAVGAAIYFVAARRRSVIGMTLGALIGAPAILAAIGAVTFIVSWLVWGGRPHETSSPAAFQEAFGIPAGVEVSQVRSSSTGSTDSYEQFLRFRAPRRTVTTIVSTRFQRMTAEECGRTTQRRSDDAPEWWTPSATPQAECYDAQPYDKRLASNGAWLLYEPLTEEVYFHYAGVD